MKTLRVISIVLVIGLLAGQAWGNIELSLEPSSQTVGLGSLVDVGIRASGGGGSAPSLIQFDLNVWFDPAILDFTSATFGDPFLGDQLDLGDPDDNPMSIDVSVGGLVRVSEFSWDSAALNSSQAGTFILASLSFEAVGLGTSPLEMVTNTMYGVLYDSQFGDSLVELSASDTGSVTVIPLPGAVLLGALGLGSAAGLLRRKRQLDRGN